MHEWWEIMTDIQDLKKMSMGEIGSMLHGLLFAYEKVFLNLFGKQEAKKLFSYIIEELVPILYDERNQVIDKSLGIEENIERLQYFLSNENFIKDLKIEKLDENKYVIDVGECVFAKEGIHEILKMKEGSCPYALIAAAVLTSVEGEDQYVNVGDSEFTELGSKTIINVE
jgi:hypothetical protein